MSASISRIITPRLHLFPATRDDAWELWELWRDPAVREPLFGLSSMSLDSAVLLVDACLRRAPGLPSLWVARSRLTTRVLGAVSLCGWPGMATQHATTLRSNPRRAEFSVATLPQVWHCGFATEAAGALLAHGFYQMGLRDAVAACGAGNTRGLQLLQRLGFKPHAHRTGDQGQCIELRLDAAVFHGALRRPSSSVETPSAPARETSADFVSTDQAALG